MAERNNLTPTAQGQGPATAAERGVEGIRSAEEIRRDIAARREMITETVDRLSDRLHQTFDWRAYVTDYPLAAVGVAAGLGFLIAGLFKRRQTPAERIKDAVAESVEDFASRFREILDDVAPRKPALSRTVKAAATGAITKVATDYLKSRMFGYASQHYEQYSD